MYQALLLDDERPHREGMARHVGWAEYGFSPPILCANGWDALDKLRDNAVDVLFTDIRMPGMDGLTFMEQARNLQKELFIAVISGYAEFHYAQTAMKNGAREYLLKPVKPEDIHRVLAEFVSWHSGRNDAAALERSGPAEAVTRILEDHLEEGIALEEIAELVHMNSSYLCTLFKKECGETIFERLARLQSEKACMLLATTNLPIAEVAHQTGARTASNFVQWFRKKMGITPAEYRRIARKGE